MRSHLKSHCRLFISSIVLLFMSFSFVAQGQSFKHPGLLNSKAELDFVKEQIAAGKEPWKSAINHIKSLNFDQRNPSPMKNLVGIDNHDPMDEMTKDGSAAYACALLWYHTGQQKYADQAIKILNAWNIFETHDNWLFLSWAVPQFLNAAEIIRTSDAGWSIEDQNKFKTMVQNRWLRPVKNNTWVNNAMMTTIEAHIAVSIYLDDKAEFQAAVNKYRTWIKSYLYIEADGNVPLVAGRATVSNYGTYDGKFLSGQLMETCRDLNHAKMGSYGLMHGAEMAYQQGVDLWKEEGDRFAAFMELHAGWMTGQRKVDTWMCKGTGIKCTGGTNPPQPPCNASNWDIAIGHIVNRLGYKLPIAQEMSKGHRFMESDTKRNFKFETLTHGDLPYDNVPYSYTFAANENDTVKVIGTMDIAFGANGEYVYLYDQTSDVVCNSEAFGSDPLPDSTKKCYVKPVVLVEEVQLDKDSVVIESNNVIQLAAIVSPSNAKNKTVIWESSDTTVVKVNNSGLVFAVSEGMAIIVAQTQDGGFEDNCKFVVVKEKFPNIEFSDGAQEPNIAENLLDGLKDDDHRWSAQNYPKSVVIDYGESKDFMGSKLYAYQNRSYHYTIAISEFPDRDFTTVVDQSGEAASQPIVHTFSNASGRYVKLTVTGCTAYANNWISINELEMMTPTTASLDAKTLAQQVVIYPNPADQILTVSFTSQTMVSDISIINLYGQELISKKAIGVRSNIAIGDLSKGVYFIRISCDGVPYTSRFIKE